METGRRGPRGKRAQGPSQPWASQGRELPSSCCWKLGSGRLRADSPGPTSPPLVIPNTESGHASPSGRPLGPVRPPTGDHAEERMLCAHTACL